VKAGTVRKGLRLIAVGVAMVILATYFSDAVARLFFLSPASHHRFVFLGLAWGAVLGCAGIITSTLGFLGAGRSSEAEPLTRPLLALALLVFLFFALFFLRNREQGNGSLRPGETITI